VYERDSDKAWIKSYCTKNDVEARLIKELPMQLNQMEQEAVVLEQLEWLLSYELKHDQDQHLIDSLVRVIEEFKPLSVEINK
jgi:hypothetical protein